MEVLLKGGGGGGDSLFLAMTHRWGRTSMGQYLWFMATLRFGCNVVSCKSTSKIQAKLQRSQILVCHKAVGLSSLFSLAGG